MMASWLMVGDFSLNTAANQQVDLLACKQGEQGAQLKDHPRVIYQQLIGCVQSADATILLVEQCVSSVMKHGQMNRLLQI